MREESMKKLSLSISIVALIISIIAIINSIF